MTLRHGAECREVLEHVAQRHKSLDGLDIAPLAELLHQPTPRVDIPQHITHVLLRSGHVDLHERLHETAAALAETLAAGHAAGDLEGHDARVDVVVRTIHQRGLHAKHREARDRTRGEHRLDALLHAWDVLFGDDAALDLLGELEV